MTMTATDVLGLPRGRPLKRADLEAMPDDGHRYELIDGTLVVTPAPRPIHQRASLSVAMKLVQACTAGMEVYTAPVDVVLDDSTVVQPDILVAKLSDLTEKDLPAAPVLAIEVLSPSTRGVDLLLKKDRFERAEVAHYWIIDPDEPSITAWNLEHGAYQEGGHAVGTELFHSDVPFPFSVVPTDLVDIPNA